MQGPIESHGSHLGEITAANMLAALLGAEGLLFAALSISVALSATSKLGKAWTVRPTALGFISAGVLTAIAVGAVFAWINLFTGSCWPSDRDLQIAALAIVVAIVSPPVISLIIAINVKRA